MAEDDLTTHWVKETDTPRPYALFTLDEGGGVSDV